MIRATYKLADPEKAEATLTVTMTVGEFRQVADAMPQAWPHWQFANAIRQMLHDANKHFAASDMEAR